MHYACYTTEDVWGTYNRFVINNLILIKINNEEESFLYSVDLYEYMYLHCT